MVNSIWRRTIGPHGQSKITQTSLSDNDLTEFLDKAKNKIFAVFKVHKQQFVYFYLMAITNVPFSNSQANIQSTIDN